MRTLAEHQRDLDSLLEPILAVLGTRSELLPIDDPFLVGRVSAAELTSATDLPPFENSQMDGYAVRTADFAHSPERVQSQTGAAGSTRLLIGAVTAAGDPPAAHPPGFAMPVMTGAPIPLGADAVIPIEQADPPRFGALRGTDARPASVSFAAAPPTGQFIRHQGEDLRSGSIVLRAGVRITPARIGLLAAAGIAAVPVRPRLRVLLITTGDELTPPGESLAPGRITDASTPLLAAALREVEALVTTERVPDQPSRLLAVLRKHAGRHDLVVTSGGISAGAFEVVREALDPLGVTFASIALQPGGPQGWGTLLLDGAQIPVLCFPGNPVSSALSLELFLLPHLRRYAGQPAALPVAHLPLAHAIDSPVHKHQVRRGRLDADGRVHLGAPGSHLLADLAEAEVLAHVPLGVSHLPADTPIEVWRLSV
ncbi:molybdopterin molybdotransferase MoeA [Leucobacter sp. W1153]|uniref:molybdopterin molybdotransferase MoeA n=1 Tax=unclassified Leucobacter TaxID=2621730 RepID=UPI003F325281